MRYVARVTGHEAHQDARTDEALVLAAMTGDAEDRAASFEVLYARHRDYVARLARRFTRDEELALDVLQDVFAYLLRQLLGEGAQGDDFRLTAKMTTFLYPVVKHTAMAARRRAGRMRLHGGGGSDDPPDPPATAAAPARGALADEDLERVLARLSDDHREALLLRFVDGLSLAEVAGRVNVPVGTVKSRLHHAIRQLRDDPATAKFFEA